MQHRIPDTGVQILEGIARTQKDDGTQIDIPSNGNYNVDIVASRSRSSL